MGYLQGMFIYFFLQFLLLIMMPLILSSSSSSSRAVILPELQNIQGPFCNSATGNFKAKSRYEEDLDSIVSSFSTTTVDGGFYYSSAGEVNAMALCRGDLSPDQCLTCINSSTHNLRRLCPNYKEAIIYYNTCSFRYSYRSIFGVYKTSPCLFLADDEKLSDLNHARPLLQKLLSGVIDEATASGPLRKYAVQKAAIGSDSETIYALAQCTPDLEDTQCADCLYDLNSTAVSHDVNLTVGSRGLHMFSPSCSLMYDTVLFYDEPPSDNTPPSSSPSGNGKKNRKRTAIVIAVPTVLAVILIISICTCVLLRMQKPKKKVETESEYLQFHLNTIKIATNNFADANKLGQDGFGAVYKGMLTNRQHITVKRRSRDSEHGELELKNEALLLAKLQHRNLVTLLGFCIEGNERLLIYEFLPNGSLDQFLFDRVKSSQLNWGRRYKIIEGVARGLLYLHEDQSRFQIIHRDLKATSILLDIEMNPKISDFGMAKLFSVDETQGRTSRVVGTQDYMAPEYAMHGNFSVKSDVYSFGVLTLEILSGQGNNFFQSGENGENLVNYAWRSWREGTVATVMDPVLGSGYASEMMRCIHIALLCVQENLADRPTMASVVVMLSSGSLTLPLLPSPASSALNQSRP